MNKLNRKPTHPGEILKEEFLNEFGISTNKLAEDLDVSIKLINNIIKENTRLDSELALKLSRYFGTSAELWLNLQNQYDIYNVLKTKRREINKIRPLKETV